jgi:hypothetical protein
MRFRVLCTVRFLHDYFADGNMGSIICVPTANTRVRLAAVGALVKLWRNELYVLIKCDGNDRPLMPLDNDFQLQFYWAPADSFFYQYTNLDIRHDKRFFYSNGFANDTGGYLYAKPPNFDDQNEYTVSSFVQAPGNDTYEALASIPVGSDLADDTRWISRGPVNYATTAQACMVMNETWELPVKPAAALVDVKVYKVLPGVAEAALADFQQKVPYTAPVSAHKFILGQLPAGLYKAVINGNEHRIFKTNDSEWPAYTGIIEIKHYAHLSAAYNLLKPDGKVNAPVYFVRFAPVCVLWQYRARSEAVLSIQDASAAIVFDQTAPFQFTSRLPVRLYQLGYKHIVLEYNNTSPPDPDKTIVIENIPVPGLKNRIVRHNKSNTDYLMSITNLNY